MDRRTFLKRMGAVGLVAAAPEVLVPDRRFWSLDRTMVPNPETTRVVWDEVSFDDMMEPMVMTIEKYGRLLRIEYEGWASDRSLVLTRSS